MCRIAPQAPASPRRQLRGAGRTGSTVSWQEARPGSTLQTLQHPGFGSAASCTRGYPISAVSQPRSRSRRARSGSDNNQQLIGAKIKACSGASPSFLGAFHQQAFFTRFFSFAAPLLPPESSRKRWEPAAGAALSEKK